MPFIWTKYVIKSIKVHSSTAHSAVIDNLTMYHCFILDLIWNDVLTNNRHEHILKYVFCISMYFNNLYYILRSNKRHFCMTNMTGRKLSIFSHPGKITGYWITTRSFPYRGQYRCVFSRCRKYVINSLIHGHFHIGLVIIPRPILALDSNMEVETGLTPHIPSQDLDFQRYMPWSVLCSVS
jgi:hypothetical protein